MRNETRRSWRGFSLTQMSVASKRAFTLIELLVVVAIIALLVSILLPSLGTARDLTRTAMCASNLHQVGIGVGMYQTEWAMDEPWLFASGTGDNPDETWAIGVAPPYRWFLPGNPAMAMAEREGFTPDSEWTSMPYPKNPGTDEIGPSQAPVIDTGEMFFCPHYKKDYVTDYSPLARRDIRTDEASDFIMIWGTYTWSWKHIPEEEDSENRSAPLVQAAPYIWSIAFPFHHNGNQDNVGDESRDALMHDAQPRWNTWGNETDYPHWNTLFVDHSVRLISKDEDDFGDWLWREGNGGWRSTN